MATFDHRALVYEDVDGFLAAMVPFVRSGLERAEPVLAAVGADEARALGSEFGDDAPGLRIADTWVWHPHPANRLRAVHEFVTEQVESGARRVRLAGQPAWPQGPPEFVLEWERYESALNEALAGLPVAVVCTYDTSRLDQAIAESAWRTHPVIWQGAPGPSEGFEDPRQLVGRRVAPFAPVPGSASVLVSPIDVSEAREFVRERAREAGLPIDRAVDVSVAVSEVLSNAVLHAGGAKSVAVWSQDGRVICEVTDTGPGIPDPLVGYRPPSVGQLSGRGLWIARQLVDLVQISPGPDGTAIRLQSWLS